jgi:hypothetical protein
MPDIPLFGQSRVGIKKLIMPEPMRYQNNAIQSNLFLVQDRTETMDAGMSMPALVLDGDAQQLSNSNLDNT